MGNIWLPYAKSYDINVLTHWGRVTHIRIRKLTTIGSDNGFSPGRRQAIIWTNAGILVIGPLGTKVIEILIGIQTFSFKKMHLKMPSAKWRPFCLGINVLTHQPSCIALYTLLGNFGYVHYPCIAWKAIICRKGKPSSVELRKKHTIKSLI